MVRINLISPSDLTDQHLIAEYNEILMAFGCFRRMKFNPSKISEKYVLGKGHITFFSDKLLFLLLRHEELSKEMLERNFKPTKKLNYWKILREFGWKRFNNYFPTQEAISLNRERIIYKIKSKPNFYRYKGSVLA